MSGMGLTSAGTRAGASLCGRLKKWDRKAVPFLFGVPKGIRTPVLTVKG
jgi:hypothetical protein